jgi:hypothetical protein
VITTLPYYQGQDEGIVFAADPGHADDLLVRDARFPGVLAALAATLIILSLLRLIGKRIGWSTKVDDVIRIVIAFFGFGGIMSFLPLVGILSDLIGVFYTSFAEGSNWGTAGKWGVGVVSLVAGGIGVYIYYKKANLINLLIMVLLTLPFYSIPWVRTVTAWWIGHAAIPFWNGFVAAWDALSKLSSLN